MKAFFDSNILIYTLVRGDPRQPVAKELIEAGGLISVQVLNEVASVARRKLRLEWPDVTAAVTALRTLLPEPISITLALHIAALTLAERYRLAIYDALIIAAAIASDCDTLFSEDMQDGLVIERRLRILNPFREVASR